MTSAGFCIRWLLLTLLVGLLSCSGGTGGTGSPVVAVGTVSEFGSIVVNGIVFDTAGATITLNGQPGSVADLRLGQVVTVRGTLGSSGTVGTAETVTFDNHARGPIDSLDRVMQRLVVLGQIVRVDDTTRFGAAPLGALEVGNIVELSGFVDADDALQATRLDRIQDAFTPGTELTSTGTVMDLENTAQTFRLHALQVDFSAAQLPDGQLRNGQVVTVTSTQNVLNGVLFAERVAVNNPGIPGNPGEVVELQGIITRVTAADTFEINGQPVRLTPSTVFERGTAADIAVNVGIEIEGILDANGVVIAEEVELGAGVELEGLITRIIAPDAFEIDGRPVRFTPSTTFEGGTAANIMPNVRVKVEGSFAADGVLVAVEIDFFVELEGRITRIITADTFAINGQTVRFTPTTMFENGTAANLAPNVRVEIAGFLAIDGVLVAAEIEFLR
jgi:hypothetical protein